jgi:nicotinamidase-related amidase
MAVELATLVDPRHTALITSECQEGIIGTASRLGPLAEVVRNSGVIERIAGLAAAARTRGVPILHCTVVRRSDHGGSTANCPLLAFARKGRGGALLPGSPEAGLVAALGPEPADYVLSRLHGVSPFHGTELDAILRNLGVRTVIATGVSLNVALLGLTIDAVNCGYQVVLPLDAAAGTPAEYVALLVEHTLRLLATVTTAAAVAAVWR